MLREGLRREIPEVFEWASRLRRPRLAREPLAWATLSAIGAGLLVDFLLLAVFGAIGRVVDLRLPIPPFEIRDILASAAAAAVALRAGGRRGLLLYLAYVVLRMLLGLSGTLRSCERFPGLTDFCTIEGYLLRLWPDALGLVLGAFAARAIASRAGTNAPLSAAGSYTVMTFPASLAFALVQDPSTMRPVDAMAIATIVSIVAGVVAGLVLRARRGRIWHAAVIAALLALAWLAPNLPVFDATYDIPGAERVLGVVSGLAGSVAILATAVITAALSRSRPPGGDASRRGAR